MAIFSGTTLVATVSLLHLTLAYFFLTSPTTIADQALVYILGESMGLPHSRGFDIPSAPLALVSALLLYIGVSDLVSLSMPEDISVLYYWGSQAPVRFFFSLFGVVYSFLFSASSPLYGGTSNRGHMAHPSAHVHNPQYVPATWGGEGFKNRVLFSFMFVEAAFWFWVWVTLREERHEVVRRHRRDVHEHYE
ncbi:hypothetical protein CFIMG_006356RA [Ceratocystis fimbriata CBS 114723]|uniref:Protein ILM1 n=1 Tax=Ceratocystis fimbriata CBS 114723 TaxID=1035309 RepID=A0A2C5WMV3_9PEZI|nr:hypothetical protein CFIMG_006356RA [Ceratocystis fimbriata CBS 114723]